MTFIPAFHPLVTDGCHKRTDRKSRVLEKSTSTSKPEFEFSRLDFPELQSPKNSNVPETQKQPRWGPLGSAASNMALLGEVGKPAAEMVEVSGRAVCLFSLSSANTLVFCHLNALYVKSHQIARERYWGEALACTWPV